MKGKFGIITIEDKKLIHSISNGYFFVDGAYLVGSNKYHITGIYRNMTIEQVNNLPINEQPRKAGLIRIDYPGDNFYPVTIAYDVWYPIPN
jgi:hypothetical protein